jgi:hypothetical protein
MNTLEIIHLRSSGESHEPLGTRIRESIRSHRRNGDAVTLYLQDCLQTDVAVHIQHLDAVPPIRPSELGLRLASELRAFGLVEHTVWEEIPTAGNGTRGEETS